MSRNDLLALTGHRREPREQIAAAPGRRRSEVEPPPVLAPLQGTAQARVGDEVGRLETHQVGLVPPMAPHGLRNIGDDVLRVLGTFSASTVVSTFDHPFVEDGPQVLVIGSPVHLARRLEEPVPAERLDAGYGHARLGAYARRSAPRHAPLTHIKPLDDRCRPPRGVPSVLREAAKCDRSHKFGVCSEASGRAL